MSLFSPDAIFGALARMVGLTPEQLHGLVTGLTSRLAAWDQEIAGFKSGSAQMVRRFDERLTVIEAGQAQLSRQLAAICDNLDIVVPEPANGKEIQLVRPTAIKE